MAKMKNTGPVARNDAYTGLLALSFLALVGATVLMAMDASELGTPPPAFKADAPGVKVGTSGDNFKRMDTTKIDTTANPDPKAPEPKVEPVPVPAPADPKTPDPKAVDPKLPAPVAPAEPKVSLLPPTVDVPAVIVPPVVQVGATEPAADIEAPKALPKLVDPSEPPVRVKPFIPPM